MREHENGRNTRAVVRRHTSRSVPVHDRPPSLSGPNSLEPVRRKTTDCLKQKDLKQKERRLLRSARSQGGARC